MNFKYLKFDKPSARPTIKSIILKTKILMNIFFNLHNFNTFYRS